MSRSLRTIFLIYAILTFLLGALLFIIPGRSLGIFEWTPIDPLITRLLGAALLAMAVSAVRGYLARQRERVQITIEANLIFCTLGAVGFLRHLLVTDYYPLYVWIICGFLALWAIIWAWILLRRK
jgi:hypothetical protein